MLSVSSATIHPSIGPNAAASSGSPTRISGNEINWEYCNVEMLEFRDEESQLMNELNEEENFDYSEAKTEDFISSYGNSSKISANSQPNISNNNLRKRRRSSSSESDTDKPAKVSKPIDKNVDTVGKNEEKIQPKTTKIPMRKRISQGVNNALDFLKLKSRKNCLSMKTNDSKLNQSNLAKQAKAKTIEPAVKSNDPLVDVILLPPSSDDQVVVGNNQENSCVSNNNNNSSSNNNNNNSINLFEEKYLESEADTPFYMNGFPNPPGENLCWLNATLHALFVLPLIESLKKMENIGFPKLIETLLRAHEFWKGGYPDKQNTYQVVREFKQQLEILDESYPSEKQQDVSEFLMIFLNYIKTEYEEYGMKNDKEFGNSDKQLTFYNGLNQQLTPKKRFPFTDISPLKQFDYYDDKWNLTPTKKRLMMKESPIGSSSSSSRESSNPIDQVFLLNMVEHYICQNCKTHRERDVDNLMLYIDLPGLETETVDLNDAIIKSMKPEERELKCDKCECNKHNIFTTFRDCPNVLMVQINRYGMTDGILNKINTPVDIPNNLILNIQNKIYKYQPICLISHVGSSIDCGHYTSYIDSRNYTNNYNQWFHYNDMDVTPMTKSEALKASQSTVYLAFFILDKHKISYTGRNLKNSL